MGIRSKDRKELRFADFREVDETASEGRKFKDVEYALRKGNGVLPNGDKLTMKDAMGMWEAPLFIPKIINNAIIEAIEPMLIGTSLLQKIPYQQGTIVDLPVIMGGVDGNFDVGETEAYPTFRTNIVPGAQISATGKSGLELLFTEETLRNVNFPIVEMYVRQGAKALARFKETKIWNMIYHQGTVSHDNLNPDDSAWGSTTGRDITGAFNGTLVVDNLFEAWTVLQHNGFTPDIMIVHPLTWLMFVQDAQLRAFAQAAGTPFYGSQWTGSPAKNDFMSWQGGMSVTGAKARGHAAYGVGNDGDGNPLPSDPTSDFSQHLTSAPVIPGYGGLNFRMVVSPFMPYNITNNTTNIILADSAELGFYIEEEALKMSEWTNPDTDIFKIRMKERYTIRGKNRGLGVAVMRNIVVGSNQIIMPAQATIATAGAITAPDRSAVPPVLA